MQTRTREGGKGIHWLDLWFYLCTSIHLESGGVWGGSYVGWGSQAWPIETREVASKFERDSGGGGA